MNAGTLKKRLADVDDEAEIFMLPAADATHYVQCCGVGTRNVELRTDDVDEDGTVIPIGSLLLFPA